MFRVLVLLSLVAISAFAEPTFQQVEGLIEQKNYAAAESGLEQIIQNHPNSAKAFYAMAQAQAGLGHLEKAQFALNKARGFDPELKFASSSNIESLQQAITPQTAKIEVVTESHTVRNTILAMFVLALGFIAYTVYRRNKEADEAYQAAQAADELARAELRADRLREAERQRQEARNKEIAAEAALKAHKNYGHERFDPTNPDKLKSVKQFKEEKLAESMVAQARAEAAEAKARAERAEMDARLARSNAASGPAYAQPTHTTVVNNSSNDMLTTMVALDMMSHHNHDTTRVVEREVIREVPTPSYTPSSTESVRSSSWDDTPSTPSRSSSWDDSSSSSSSSSWSSSSSDSSSSWSSSDSSDSSSSSSDW